MVQTLLGSSSSLVERQLPSPSRSRGGQLTLARHAPHESTLHYTACTDIKSKGDVPHD